MRIAFTGHQNLPQAARTFLCSELERVLAGVPELVGVCSLAEGGDQLFATSVLRCGGSLEVVIPSENYENTFDPNALARYLDLRSKAKKIIRLSFTAPSEQAYMDAGRRVVDAADVLYAAWDGEESGGLGGTADVVAYARSVSKPVVIIWPQGVARNND